MEEKVKLKIEKIVSLMGFEDYSVNYDENLRKFLIFINDIPLSEENTLNFINALEHFIRLMGKKENFAPYFIDVNNYRKKREALIVELARAAARKSRAEKKEVSLPAMSAYERKIIHLTIQESPDLTTESIGEGENRYVVIKPI